ncbi:translation initiation factor IF-3 [Cellulomonas sp. URHB0016]
MLRTGAFLVPGGRSRRTRGATISEPRINDRIRVAEVRLVGPNGEQVGIVRVEDALRLAQDADLDLVEVAPEARPPVCKIMDYGKFKYEADMKAREARRNQTNTVLKEIRFRLKIDPHDYGTKKGHVTRFLAAGDKVKVMIMFRGREQSRPEMGIRLLQRLADDVADLGFVESAPKQDGRNMIMVLGPVKKKADQKQEQRRQAQADAARAANAAAAASASAPVPAAASAAPAAPVASEPVAVPVEDAAVEPAAVDAPAAEAPVAETAAAETPAAETPAAAPVAETPVAEPVAAPEPAAVAPARAAAPRTPAPRPAAARPATPRPSTARPAASASPAAGPASPTPRPAAPRATPAAPRATPAAPKPVPRPGPAAGRPTSSTSDDKS